MLTLDLTNAPRWHDLAPGFRVQLRPLTTALMVAGWGSILILGVTDPLGGINHAADLGDSDAFGEVARRHDATPQQVALAWELAQHDCVIPIPGASRPESIVASLAALDLVLDQTDLDELDRAVGGGDQPVRAAARDRPPRGSRCP